MPAEHATHEDEDDDQTVPAEQARQEEEPGELNEFTPHGVHDVAPPVEKVLAWQVWQAVAPEVGANVPEGHQVQVPPATGLKAPAAQKRHEPNPSYDD